MISFVPPEDESLPQRPEFQTTHWSVVLAAAEAHAALEQLCRTYWYPLYAFIRREGCKADEAQDLTQAFFVRIPGRRDFASATVGTVPCNDPAAANFKRRFYRVAIP